MNIKDFKLLPTGWKVAFVITTLLFILFAIGLAANIVILYFQVSHSTPTEPTLALGDIVWLIGLGALLRWILTKKVV